LHDQDSLSNGNEHQTHTSITDIAQILTGYSFLNSLQGKVTNESQVTNDGKVTNESQVTNPLELLTLYLQTAELRIHDIIRDHLLPCHIASASISDYLAPNNSINPKVGGTTSSSSLYQAIYLIVQALQHVVINVYALFLAPINVVAAAPSSSSSASSSSISVSGKSICDSGHTILVFLFI